MAAGEYCPPEDEILTSQECRTAATSLGLVFDRDWAGAGDHKLCAFAEDGRYMVYFNTAESTSPYPTSQYASLCWKVTPYQEREKCQSGDEETEVTSAGSWAIAIYCLSGVWSASLWFVVILVGFGNRKVHPEPRKGSKGGNDKEGGKQDSLRHGASDASNLPPMIEDAAAEENDPSPEDPPFEEPFDDAARCRGLRKCCWTLF